MTAEGLCGVTFIPHEMMLLKRTLGVPDDYEVAVLIPIGYPQKYFDIKTIATTREDTL